MSEHGYACKKVMVDQSVQTTIQKAHLGEYEDENLLNEGSMRRKLLLKDVMKDDTSCNFYTGILSNNVSSPFDLRFRLKFQQSNQIFTSVKHSTFTCTLEHKPFENHKN